jgi:hypothetical protein
MSARAVKKNVAIDVPVLGRDGMGAVVLTGTAVAVALAVGVGDDV